MTDAVGAVAAATVGTLGGGPPDLTQPILAFADGQLAVVAAAILVLVWGLHTALAHPIRWRWLVPVVVLAAAGAGLRAWVGPGPADVGEVTRWNTLYAALPGSRPQFASAVYLADLLRSWGAPTDLLYLSFGPLVSGLVVVATAWLAHLLGLRPLFALVAAGLVALWPQHVVNGAAASMTIWASLLLLGQAIVALAPAQEPIWRLLGLLGWTTLACLARPELRIAPLFALLWAWQWPWRHKVALVLGCLLLVGGLQTGDAVDRLHAPEVLDFGHLAWLMWRWEAAPIWLIWLGFLGLGWHQPRPRALALLAPVVALFAIYHLNRDGNGVVGPWRYFLSFLPLLCVGAGRMAGHFATSRLRTAAVIGVFAGSLAPYAPLWLTPTDMNAEFAAVRSTGAAVVAASKVLVLDNHDGDLAMGAEHLERVLLALHLATGLRWQEAHPRGPEGPLGHLGDLPVYGLGAWLRLSAKPPGPTAVWCGLATPQHMRDAITQQASPTSEVAPAQAAAKWQTVTVWNATAAPGGWCPPQLADGLRSPKCTLVLGWIESGTAAGGQP
jgi:hypothetical protein